MTRDDKGPMQEPRKTRDVMKSAPASAPMTPEADDPTHPPTDAATQGVKTDQEDA